MPPSRSSNEQSEPFAFVNRCGLPARMRWTAGTSAASAHDRDGWGRKASPIAFFFLCVCVLCLVPLAEEESGAQKVRRSVFPRALATSALEADGGGCTQSLTHQPESKALFTNLDYETYD